MNRLVVKYSTNMTIAFIAINWPMPLFNLLPEFIINRLYFLPHLLLLIDFIPPPPSSSADSAPKADRGSNKGRRRRGFGNDDPMEQQY